MSYRVAERLRDGFRTICLENTAQNIAVEVCPDIGNNAFSFSVDGREFLWRGDLTLDELLKRRALFGIPLLSPWANRLQELSFRANGTRYQLNPALENLRFDHYGQPIHGLLLFERWDVQSMQAGGEDASVTASFDFTGHPRLMAQFPFAHRLEMRHTLRGKELTVEIRIQSECSEPIPVSLGFHPYFTLPASTRNDWKLHVPANRRYVLSERNIPTGEVETTVQQEIELSTVELDDVFSGLQRNGNGDAFVECRSQDAYVRVRFPQCYPFAVIYAPRIHNFVCLEPMAAITNALNVSSDGTSSGLQLVLPGQLWTGTFSVEAGFAT